MINTIAPHIHKHTHTIAQNPFKTRNDDTLLLPSAFPTYFDRVASNQQTSNYHLIITKLSQLRHLHFWITTCLKKKSSDRSARNSTTFYLHASLNYNGIFIKLCAENLFLFFFLMFKRYLMRMDYQIFIETTIKYSFIKIVIKHTHSIFKQTNEILHLH